MTRSFRAAVDAVCSLDGIVAVFYTYGSGSRVRITAGAWFMPPTLMSCPRI
jgi:hypothetical protein